MVVLPSFSCVGELVPVSALPVARSAMTPLRVDQTLPVHLEDIVAGSHPSLGSQGRARLRTILHQYAHVFPPPVSQSRDVLWQSVMTSTPKALGRFGVGHVGSLRRAFGLNKHAYEKCLKVDRLRAQ